MKLISFCLIFAALCGACCTTKSPGGKGAAMTTSEANSVPFRVLGKGSYAALPGRSRDRVLPESTLPPVRRRPRSCGRKLIGGMAMPPVDFSKESVVFLIMGMRSTGGYAVVPQAVATPGKGVTVTAEMQSPSRGDIVTQAFSAPYAVIAVSRPGIHSAVWVRAGDVVAKSE